jgi:hypothetical protein
MASIRNLSRAVLAALAMTPAFAQALTLRADFSGTSHAEQILQFPPVPVSWYDDQPISGWFEVEIADAQPFDPENPGSYWYNGGPQRASFTVRGEQFGFASDALNPGVMSFDDHPNGQSLGFRSDILPKYHGYLFTISGPSGSLFDGSDPSTIRILPGAPYSFSTGFADATAAMRVGITLDRMNFRVLAPVPEPSTVLLMLGGGVALICWQRRRKPAL